MSDDPLPFQVFTEIGIIEHLARTAAERVLPEGLSMAGFAVLNHMIRRKQATDSPARIASALQVTKGAMTGALKRLETEGWIAVTPDPADGRGKQVRVTMAGKAVRAEAISRLQPLFDDLVLELDARALEKTLRRLRRLRSVMDAARSR